MGRAPRVWDCNPTFDRAMGEDNSFRAIRGYPTDMAGLDEVAVAEGVIGRLLFVVLLLFLRFLANPVDTLSLPYL
jgi:hypothetical protein